MKIEIDVKGSMSRVFVWSKRRWNGDSGKGRKGRERHWLGEKTMEVMLKAV